MKQLVVLAGLAVFLLGIAGCGRQEALHKVWDGEPPDEEALPEFLVGVWEVKTGQYKDKWGIKFEPDGSILKIIYEAKGPVYLAEGESYGEAGDEGAYYLFTVGPCEARYAPETRILKVKIVMEHMLQLSFGELEGGIEDYFEGTVSEDGKTWEAKWSHYLWFEEEGIPEPNVIEAEPIPLVFTKTDIE